MISVTAYFENTFSQSFCVHMFSVYTVENRELPGFTAAITEYVISFECHDNYQSTAIGTLTVTIKPNETPTITNLDGMLVSLLLYVK